MPAMTNGGGDKATAMPKEYLSACPMRHLNAALQHQVTSDVQIYRWRQINGAVLFLDA
jgi:hypothetical protein